MRATLIEVRTRALRAGRTVGGRWEPAGQLVARLWLEEPSEELARDVAAAITMVRDEEVVAEVVGRREVE